MARTFGVGLIGAGNISTAYLKLAPLFKGLEVRAVTDLVPEAARARAAEYGISPMTPDEMLGHSEIDVVVNLTVPKAHFRVSMDAISAGKHVYSEKPFVLALKEGKALKKAADARGLSVGSAPDTFLGGAHQQVRDMVDRGQVGKITHGTTHVMGRGMEHWHPNPAFFFQPGGGPVLDMGPYYVTELVQLLGPVRRVTAFTGRGITTRTVSTPNSPMLGKKIKVEVATTIHGVLEFHSGAIITIGASWDTHGHGHHNIELYGTNGSIFVPDPNFFGGEIFASDVAGKRSKVEPWDHPFDRPNYTDPNSGDQRANYRAAGLADMVQAIGKGKPARCGIDQALHVIDVLTSLLRAGETGKVITLTTTCDRPRALKPKDAAALLK
jgi:predicted dehydrogenase